MLKLGETIKKRRELLRLLQPDLSAISGINRRTIQLVEQGKGNPSLDTLIRICSPLGLSIHLGLKEIDGITE
jgi:transcriptional regulator with XRE-family HTH domain